MIQRDANFLGEENHWQQGQHEIGGLTEEERKV